MRFGTKLLRSLLIGIGFSSAANGGIVPIAQVFPTGAPRGVDPMVTGLAFDGANNAIILDSWTWTISRVSLTNGSIVSASSVKPIENYYSAALTYNSTAQCFFALAENQDLVRIDPKSLVATEVGNGVGEFFNWNGMATDPAGNLWLATNASEGDSLWEVDQQTGVATRKATIQFPLTMQVTALAIDDQDHFIVYANQSMYNVQTYFWNVDPVSGSVTKLSDAIYAAYPQPSDMLAMAYDPNTKGIYGLEENFVPNTPVTFELVQITGVPEPASMGLLAIIALASFYQPVRRRRKSSISH